MVRALAGTAVLILAIAIAACDNGIAVQGEVPGGVGTIAELVITNGNIYTVDRSRPWVEAVAVAGGKYLYVGDNTSAAAYVGEGTHVIDLQGAMAMPGINEVHAHAWQGGIKELFECNFAFTATPDEIAATVKACVKANPEAVWITGGQWTSDFFKIFAIDSPRKWLDKVSGDKAVYFEDDATHNAWVNSKALALAGVDKHTIDPEGGTYVRDERGEPNGLVLETAMPLLASHIPEWTIDQNVAALTEAVRLANSFGLTGIHEARTPASVSRAYQRLDQDGGLTAYAITNLQTPRGQRDEPFDVGELEAISERYRSAHVYTKFAKVFLDGVPTASRTAVMVAPYLEDDAYPQAGNGMLLVSLQALVADLIELDRRGFTVKIHTAGDGAVRVALDAIEQVRAINGASGLRHELAHAGFIHPDDLPRFAALNVTADLSPYLWYPRPINDSIVGAVGERALYYWPIKDLLASGANVAAGSDWPSVADSVDPWPAIEAMVTRRNPFDARDDSLWPEQAITLNQALKIFTLDGARAHRLDHLTGSVEVGKSAELIVLNQHLFDVPIEAVSETRPVLTLFEGKVVFEDS
jgi:predicted amidohydrolase YtcJ